MLSKTFVNIFDNQLEHEFMNNGPEFIFNVFSSEFGKQKYNILPVNYFRMIFYKATVMKNETGSIVRRHENFPHQI
jgi:hypothetical protein